MKKIAFFIRDLNFGGIESNAINLLKTIDYDKYDVTLFVKKKIGNFNNLPENLKVVVLNFEEYNKNLKQKIFSRIKKYYYIIKYFNKFDFTGCFTDYCGVLSSLTRFFSKNNAMWLNSNYYTLLNESEEKVITFFKRVKPHKFKNLFAVSEDTKNSFVNIFPNLNSKIVIIDLFLKEPENNVKSIKKKNYTFLNVSRHDEKIKKISYIIKASKKLIDEKNKFSVWLVGEGKDTNKYKKMVKKLGLEKNISFFGFDKETQKFYISADCFIMCSESEGGPLVILESLTHSLPFISTDVGFAKKYTDKNYGLLIDKSIDGVYNGMKKMLNVQLELNKDFDILKFNKNSIEKLYKVIEGVNNEI